LSVRIGFVGAGGIAKSHMAALAKVPEARPVAFADVDLDRAAEAAARFAGAAAYGDAVEMLDSQELDAVYVCVPPHAHGDIELALIERGIAFFVEKPIGRDRDVPRRVLAALEGKDLITAVGYMMRYRSNAERVRNYLAENEAVLARGAWIGGMPGVYWWRRKELSGGQINEQTTHIFDLARYLFGEVRSVYCAARAGLVTDVEDYSVEDASICLLTFESGLVCEISSSCAVASGEVMLEAFTRTGRARLEGWGLDLTLSDGSETHHYKSGEDIFLVEDSAFVEAVSSGDRSGIRSTYADAVRTQMVTCAADESLASGQPAVP